jgi:AcrR family transcriptional regulator
MTKRDAILKAAEKLFAQAGYGLTGVDALAAEAGVTKRTLYKQFGSKEALYAEWLRGRDAATRGAMLRAVEALSDEPRGQLLALFDVLAQLGQKPDFRGCPFSRALIEFGANEAQGASRAIAEEHKAALTHWFADRLRAAGVHDIEAATEELAMLYEGTLGRIAATHKPDAAYAARRLLAARLSA